MTDLVDRAKMAAQLEEEEGYRRYPYKDSLGYETIGIGRCIDARLYGEGITHMEAVYLLENNIEEGEHELTLNVSWWQGMSEVRRRVLLDMWFNMGMERLSKFRNTLAAMQRGNLSAAVEGMKNSLWYRQVGHRAERLVRMFELDTNVEKWW